MPDLTRLTSYVARVPATSQIEASDPDDTSWWVSFKIDPDARMAWNVVQEVAYVCNGLSVAAKLPVRFVPESDWPRRHGGPRACLRWRIEATTDDASADLVAEYLEGRLPRPVDDLSKWGDLDHAVPESAD